MIEVLSKEKAIETFDIKSKKIWTYEEYAELPDPDGRTRYEVINGEVFIMTSPILSHQMILGNLFRLISNYLDFNPIGQVYISSLDVHLSRGNIAQPDIIFVLNENIEKIGITPNDRIHGIPDLLVEILSPSNKKHDLVRKRNVYLEHKIKEYWIIDPYIEDTNFFILETENYINVSLESGVIRSEILNGLQFRLDDIYKLTPPVKLVNDHFYVNSYGALKIEGIQEGKKREKLETAKNMLLKQFDYETISDITGLSVDEIESIK